MIQKLESITDDELNRLLDELGFHAKAEREKTLFVETFKHTQRAPKKEQEEKTSSLKSSLFITLFLLLFTVVQATFMLPLFKTIKNLEKKLEKIEISLEELKNKPFIFEQNFPKEEIIQPLPEVNGIYNKS